MKSIVWQTGSQCKDRRTGVFLGSKNIYRKLPNNSWGAYLFQSLNRPGVYLGPGGNLGQAGGNDLANQHSWLSLTVVYICFAIALIILQDTLSWHARLLITHPCMFISSSLLAFFLPPPGSPTLLLSSTETSSGCFSRFPVFRCIFYNRKFAFQVLFIFVLHRSHGDHQCDIDWQKASTIREKGKEEKCTVSEVTSSSLIFPKN